MVILLKLNPANHRAGRYLQRCKLMQRKNPFTYAFPRIVSTFKKRKLLLWTSTISLQSHFQQKTLENERLEPEKISSLKRKNNSSSNQTYKPSLYDLPSPPSVSSHPRSWILQSQCAQGTKHGMRTQPGKLPGDGGKCGQKAGKSSWKQRKVTRIFGTKIGKNHPGINFYMLHKKGAIGRGSFCCIELGCI